MKKRNVISTLLSLCLALAMCIALAVPGFAATDATSSATKKESSTGLFAGGSGTKADPYEIANVKQLLAINTDLGANYELVADLDFEGVEAWLPIGYYSIDIEAMMAGSEEVPAALAFHGTFDGNGHTMKNLDITTVNPMAAGVFGFTGGNAYLHDINIENFSTKGILCCGSLVGWASGKTVIENVTVKNVNNRGMTMVGALCGSSNGDVTVKNVKVNGGSSVAGYSLLGGNVELIAGYGQAGGVIGGADGTAFANCSVKNFKVVNKISGNDGFGGLAGCANEAKYIKNCSVENVTIKSTAGPVGYIGGLVGFTGTEAGIKNAAKASKVTGCTVKNVKIIASDEAQCVGGLIGGGTYRSDEQSEPFAYQVSNCRVSNVTMKTGGRIIGSIAGYTGNNSSVKSCTSKNVTINGKTLSAKVGADPSVIPYTELTQFGGAL
jgi:hypothetical protein